ncbi:hypothetical protein UFOVP673_44 [uncultured Caudovirales phage]|uniref:Uncharacterized protein n=1 Tax=uncultured Caudovirales phage TaxID=2100421 RepID=A0A6J5NC13_9CAUD|nr:hypothetical protein UFOVP673_44 [uncultured Caudovirales phage]
MAIAICGQEQRQEVDMETLDSPNKIGELRGFRFFLSMEPFQVVFKFYTVATIPPA